MSAFQFYVIIAIQFILLSCNGQPGSNTTDGGKIIIQERLKQYLILHDSLNQQLVFTENALVLSTSTSKLDIIDTLLYQKVKSQTLNKIITGFNPTDKLPLNGLRIAIDPGHSAETINQGILEGKYIKMKLADADSAIFFEAHLALATALQLKDSLENAGAIVFLTKTSDKPHCLNLSFREWFDQGHIMNDLNYAYQEQWITEEVASKITDYLESPTSWSERYIYGRLYNQLELRCRCETINQFKPHFTLFIHYNVDAENSPWVKPTSKNFNMAFVPGAFGLNELQRKEDVQSFKRMIEVNTIQFSIELSKEILDALTKTTKVPVVQKEDEPDYIKENTLPTGISGLYCRNLAMNRLVQGISCYGETLYQDNEYEVRLLNDKSLQFDSFSSSKRTTEVANGYYQGILNFSKNISIHK